ncbi:MAG: 5'-nucleotidase C-terminal domain-containing protein [Ferruginibacter sp.]
MRKISKLYQPGLWLIILAVSCTTSYQAQKVEYSDYRITSGLQHDSAIIKLLQPYADSINKTMNDVIAVSDMELSNKHPEGTLGNLLADAMRIVGEKKYNMHIDAAFMNSGGIRLPVVPKGDITLGKVYEIIPFDNVLILQKVSGKVLLEFLNLTADRGGWPTSGITMQIKNKKAVNIKIGGADLNELATYTIANNDYVANGGDNCQMLKDVPQINNGFLARDAVVEYFKELQQAGKKINAKIENRVTYAE